MYGNDPVSDKCTNSSPFLSCSDDFDNAYLTLLGVPNKPLQCLVSVPCPWLALERGPECPLCAQHQAPPGRSPLRPLPQLPLRDPAPPSPSPSGASGAPWVRWFECAPLPDFLPPGRTSRRPARGSETGTTRESWLPSHRASTGSTGPASRAPSRTGPDSCPPRESSSCPARARRVSLTARRMP